MKPDCKYFKKCSVNDCPKLNDSRLESVVGDPETVCRMTHLSRVEVQKHTVITGDFDGILRVDTEPV